MRNGRAMTFVVKCVAAAGVASAQCEPVWSSVGAGASWEVSGLAVFDDDGAGPLPPALYAAGAFGEFGGVASPLVARWDGWSASALGAGLTTGFDGLRTVHAIPELIGKLAPGAYFGGEIMTAGGKPVNNIARWDGSAWHDVGGGLTADGFVLVSAMSAFDEDGEGPLPPALFVGGRFQFAGGEPVSAIARWDGERWSKVGGGLQAPPERTPTVNALAVFDDGRGSALYAGGSFAYADGEERWNIARWDGHRWEAVGPGLATTVESLCTFDEDGAGPRPPALFAGGQFSRVRGGERHTLMRIGRWDGVEWTAVGGWRSAGAVLTMTTWDSDGPGPDPESLYIGGFFNIMPDSSPANQIARWDGERWHTVGGGVAAGVGVPAVRSLGVFDEDGPGPNPGGLYVGGLFGGVGSIEAKNIARWGCPLPATPCYADCDGDGELAFFDFLCFQNQFAVGDTLADCDYNGDFTFFDFLCFQTAFAAGCP